MMRRHQQIQKRGFPAAGIADDRIGLSRLKLYVDVMQDLISLLVGEVKITDRNAVFQTVGDVFSLVADV